MAVIAIAGDDLVVALFDALLNADRHGLLADVQVAEAADQAHAVQLARALLEATDQNHFAIEAKQVFLGRRRRIGQFVRRCRLSGFGWGFRHPVSPG